MGKSAARGIFQTSFHVPGELSANLNIRWTAPCDMTLLHVSAVQSDDDACGVTLGISTDTDGYLEIYSCGISDTPVEKEAISDFSGTTSLSQYPRISDGDILVLIVDYDYKAGAGSGAASDVTIVLTFAEG